MIIEDKLVKKSIFKRTMIKPSPTQFIVLGFLVVILIGAFLLTLPISSRSGEYTSFINALFTATSATCVTGLVVVDTYTYWSRFGQIVILFLIQTGGLGFMTIATSISFFLKRRITLKERLLIGQTLNQSDIQGVVLLTKRVLTITFIIEFIGAFILSFRFIPNFGALSGIYRSIFTAVSAFCNAGFDVLGDLGKYSGLTNYATDYTVNITVMSLITIGGLGFLVWTDLLGAKRNRRLKLHTIMVLSISGILIVFGAMCFFIFEYSNQATIGNFTVAHKILASFFQSVTTRTAGFNTISQNGLTEASKALSSVLMFIGGSPGSTAGGIKTVTAGVLVFSVIAVIRGYKDTNVLGRRIDHETIMQATTISLIAFTMVGVATTFITIIEGRAFMECLFEAVSAFGTVGLSLGMTPTTTTVTKLILVMLMYLGRVGIITMTFALVIRMNDEKAKVRYPKARVMVG